MDSVYLTKKKANLQSVSIYPNNPLLVNDHKSRRRVKNLSSGNYQLEKKMGR